MSLLSLSLLLTVGTAQAADVDCSRVSTAQITWSAVSAGAGVLSGAGGLGTIIPKDPPEGSSEEEIRKHRSLVTGFGVAAMGFGALGAASGVASLGLGNRYQTFCSAAVNGNEGGGDTATAKSFDLPFPMVFVVTFSLPSGAP